MAQAKTKSNTVSLPATGKPQLAKVVNTRLSAGSAKVSTNLTVIFDSEELTREFAMRGAVIAMQALWRDAGVIPGSETVSLTELKKRSGERGGFGSKPTPEKAVAAINKLDEAAYESVLKNLGIKAPEIKKLMEARRKAIGATAG